VFPEVSFSTALLRTEAIRGSVVVNEKMAEIRDEIGEELFRRIIQANEMDLVLYDFAKSQLEEGNSGMRSASFF
jgi:NTP pyrophosphatase (non-canonical NTP hydrolase)